MMLVHVSCTANVHMYALQLKMSAWCRQHEILIAAHSPSTAQNVMQSWINYASLWYAIPSLSDTQNVVHCIYAGKSKLRAFQHCNRTVSSNTLAALWTFQLQHVHRTFSRDYVPGYMRALPRPP